MKMIIHRMPYGIDYPQHAIRTTQYALRTPSHGDFLGISLIFGIQFSIIHNKLNTKDRMTGDFVIDYLRLTIDYFFRVYL